MTKRKYFTEVKEILIELGKTELIEHTDYELELLERKASSRKPTAKQQENEELKEIILEVLANYARYCTIKEIQKGHALLQDLYSQRISALLKQLREEQKVVRKEENRIAMFRIA